jgi:hypothetical protein
MCEEMEDIDDEEPGEDEDDDNDEYDHNLRFCFLSSRTTDHGELGGVDDHLLPDSGCH